MMVRLSGKALRQTEDGINLLLATACLVPMEKALLGDALELVQRIQKYSLTYKIEVVK